MADTLTFNGTTIDLAGDTQFASSNVAVKVVLQISPTHRALFEALKGKTAFDYIDKNEPGIVQEFHGTISKIVNKPLSGHTTSRNRFWLAQTEEKGLRSAYFNLAPGTSELQHNRKDYCY